MSSQYGREEEVLIVEESEPSLGEGGESAEDDAGEGAVEAAAARAERGDEEPALKEETL